MAKSIMIQGTLRAIGRQKGMDTTSMRGVDYQSFKESQYDLLADGLRKNLDMEKIYQILDRGGL